MLMLFLQANMSYPPDALREKITGKVYVSFTVDKTGKIIDPFVSKSANHRGMDTEALRVVKSMPAWNPGYWDGETEEVRFTLPVVFGLAH